MTHKSVTILLEELRHMGESSRIEAKLGSEAGKAILQTVCAFANEPAQGGGYLLLGVQKEESGDDDDFPSYKAVGVSNPEKLKDDLSSQCASEFNISIRPIISEEMIDGKCVLGIFIPEARESDKPVYFAKTGLPKGAYRRIGASDMRCTDEDLELLYGNRSGKVFDQKIVEGASINDIDPEAIKLYRRLRAKASEAAEELSWNDNDLLQSLRCITEDSKGNLVPTICGMVVFGKSQALRRLFPMWRVDYIRVPSTVWVDDPDNRFISIEMRDPLLQTMIRAEAAILADIPKAFHLPEGSMQRRDIPLVPQRAIREALLNCLMHRNYSMHSPAQIIHYTNRLEFNNSGYSLLEEDRFGQPISVPRNPAIATILHDLDFAETKGSGIRTMITLMTKHGLAPPTFNSYRRNNLFTATLLFHHFLDEKDIEWLAQFGEFGLNDAQKKAMIYIREQNYIDNETYRRLNSVDTLEASQSLQAMRNKGLIAKEGKGNATYYKMVFTSKTHMPESITHKLKPITHELSSKTHKLNNGKTHMPETKTHKPKPVTHELSSKTHMPTPDELPEEIRLLINRLGKKSTLEQKIKVVLALCKWKALTAEEVCAYLHKKDALEMVRKVLTPMVKDGLLELTIPASRKHPHQRYRAK